MNPGCILAGLVAWAVLALLAWLVVHVGARRPTPTPPRRPDPAVRHALWCATCRTGRPDDCDCTAGWLGA